MEVSNKIVRRSIHSFLQNYHSFTTTIALLAFPFSASILFSQALIPFSSLLLPQIYNHLKAFFDAANFPSSQFFTILNLKISQTITSSIFTLPFTLTFLLIAKASTIHALNNYKHKGNLPQSSPSFTSIISSYKPLFHTYIYNSFFIFSANASSFCLLFLAFSFSEGFGETEGLGNTSLFLSAVAAVFFSVILANALVICNMALTISGMEGNGGFMAILKACVLLRGKTSMALFLALPMNIGLAAIEALFQFRVVRAYHNGGISWPFIALEGIFIAYLYSIFIIIDTIVSCMFYKSCKMGLCVDKEEKGFWKIEFLEEGNCGYLEFKNLQELP